MVSRLGYLQKLSCELGIIVTPSPCRRCYGADATRHHFIKLTQVHKHAVALIQVHTTITLVTARLHVLRHRRAHIVRQRDSVLCDNV